MLPEGKHSKEVYLGENGIINKVSKSCLLIDCSTIDIKTSVEIGTKAKEKGIKITSLKGSKDCPDHIFPNWFITFEDKTAQLFSMCAPNRRLEKTPEMIGFLKQHYSMTGDLSNFENENIFLEYNLML